MKWVLRANKVIGVRKQEEKSPGNEVREKGKV